MNEVLHRYGYFPASGDLKTIFSFCWRVGTALLWMMQWFKQQPQGQFTWPWKYIEMRVEEVGSEFQKLPHLLQAKMPLRALLQAEIQCVRDRVLYLCISALLKRHLCSNACLCAQEAHSISSEIKCGRCNHPEIYALKFRLALSGCNLELLPPHPLYLEICCLAGLWDSRHTILQSYSAVGDNNKNQDITGKKVVIPSSSDALGQG